MIQKNIDEIELVDIEQLITDKVLEKKTIEYKREININTKDEKKEFLADISSFANTIGGDLIFGMVQDRESGEPKEIVGIEVTDPDELTLKIENLITMGVSPRIPHFDTKPIEISTNRWIFIIRMRESWIKPHRVIIKGHGHFYARNTAGKYTLDVNELKNLFVLADSLNIRMKEFQTERIYKLIQNEPLYPLYGDQLVVVHIIPFIAFDPNSSIDIQNMISDSKLIWPMDSGGFGGQYNFEGYLAFISGRDKALSYTQLFRNGIIEGVNSILIRENEIPSISFESKLVKYINKVIKFYQDNSIPPPFFVCLSLINVKDTSMSTSTHQFLDQIKPIKYSNLIIPERIIKSYEISVEKDIKPIFDIVWNACGFSQSEYFDSEGNWTLNQR